MSAGLEEPGPQPLLRDEARCLAHDRLQGPPCQRAVQRDGECLPRPVGHDAAELRMASPYRHDFEPEGAKRAQDVTSSEPPKPPWHSERAAPRTSPRDEGGR